MKRIGKTSVVIVTSAPIRRPIAVLLLPVNHITA
jgi:hypothetical protein